MSSSAPESNIEYRIAVQPTGWLDRIMDKCALVFGAIVVKEFRQTLKGYQVYVLCGALLAIALLFQADPLNMNRWEYVNEDDTTWFARFDGFFRMLSATAFIFIPFWLYRSMAIEFKQGAFELLSITSMSAWRIVVGKMTVAAIQLLIYTSVLLPFIFLETNSAPIGLFDVLVRMALLFCMCMAISGFAVMLATFINRGTWQIAGMLAVLAVGAGLLSYYFNLMFLLRNYAVRNPNVNEVAPQIITLTLSASLVLASAFSCFSISKLQFTSSNRATPVRLGFALFQWAMCAAIVFVLLNVTGFGVYTAVYLYVGLMCLSIFGGSMLVGDMPYPSQRVIRDNLAWWKRLVLIGWLPGSRRAFLFSITNHLLIAGILILVIKTGDIFPESDRLVAGILVGCGYVVVYTMIAWLVCLPIKTNPSNRVAAAGITAICLLVIGTIVPNTISLFADQRVGSQYSPYFIMDMAYTVIFYSRQNTNYDQFIHLTVTIASSVALVIAAILYLLDELAEQKMIKHVRTQSLDNLNCADR